jgi:hypothetical protein
VNAVSSTINSAAISGNRVQLTLASAIKYGDVITVSYTKPSTNPLQTSTGVQAISISSQLVVNNLINPVKNLSTATISLSVYPNHVHRVANITLAYSSTPSVAGAVASPELIRITDLYGKLYIQKELVIGATSIRIPLNLRSGIYTVNALAGGVLMATKRMVVY